MKKIIQTLLTRAFLQTGLGVTFGFMFATAYRNSDYLGMGLMVLGVIVTFLAFAR